ncbi:polysaccharide pyruvyl transferase family protein [Vibrio cholerae]|nr:polysaccharide pyruvyl transferase family protein [Vibrio cholerae]
MKALILHAYSANNAGDGLLVDEAVKIARQVVGPKGEVVLLASHPETFREVDATVIDSAPSSRGYRLDYLRTLARIRSFTIVLGVGGGYLRAGTCIEALKTALVHGPQLLAASTRTSGVIYLPQSVGPLKFGLGLAVCKLMKRFDHVYLRDDRSVDELRLENMSRVPDLAAVRVGDRLADEVPDSVPILSIRKVRNEFPAQLKLLAEKLCNYDMYVQSTSAGNDDRPVSSLLNYRQEISAATLFKNAGQKRVIVAVRLHAALMALQAGHYVIHLAYERKGFGAFSDLGLDEYVHNVNDFSVNEVLTQVRDLTASATTRSSYNQKMRETCSERQSAFEDCLTTVALSARSSDDSKRSRNRRGWEK